MKGATWLIVSLALCWDSAWGNVVKVNLDDTLKYNHVGVEGDDTPKPDEDDWWKNAVFYQIYPRSFRDNDRDGDGDLKGVIEKLPYLKELGITGAWLSPIFKSPEADQGYDVSDYRSINERFGTMADLTELVKEAHKLGLKIILDFVPNHTSDQHDWFQKSVAGTDRYKDYYVWKDGKYNKTNGVRLPPNNWISTFKGSAWKWNDQRQQYYLHQFSEQQPDLNYRNPNVVKEMMDILDYWLGTGVDGFRVDAVPYLVEDADLTDEPLAEGQEYDQNNADCLKRIYTKDTNDTYNVIYEIRDYVDKWAKAHNQSTKVLMSEAYTDIDSTMRYYGTATGDKRGAHFTFNFELLGKLTDKDFKVTDVINAINSWLKHMPSIYTANWVLGNHDNHRVATRLGEKNVDAFNMLTAFLPGIMVTYNGEEIGMTDGEVTCEQGKDPQAIKDCSTYRETSRDFERTPMQWNSGPNAGFTDGDKKPWLPVASNYRQVNVENENGTETSHLSIYKQLLQFRKDHLQSMSSKDVLEVKGESDNVVKIVRERDDAKYMLLFNVADEAQEVTLNKHSLLLTTHPKARKVGDILDTIKLEAHESVILKSAAGIQMAASLLMVALYSIVHFVI